MTTTTPKTFAGTSTLGSYADAYCHSWAFKFFDDYNLWGDDKAVDKQDIPKTAAPPADNLNTWADTYGSMKADQFLSIPPDQLDDWKDFLRGLKARNTSIGTDNFDTWQDVVGFNLGEITPATPITVELSDAAGSGWVLVASG